ncbi:hypothetical protein NC653_024495 [Populus alba x Populus x berolinensis]|uniref:Uncharacterized protein n=1 Tax=Populus alba x Populus x berolinensis TaxID=444605 RepID=A0AAD6M9J0_9ROSI|nr:hypothetical protein NC653_024495 [Populus alba x Populus x berolinensis]
MVREQKRKRRIIRMDWSGIIAHAHNRRRCKRAWPGNDASTPAHGLLPPEAP